MSEFMHKKILPNDILLSEVSRLVAEGEKVTLMTKGQSMLPFIRGGKDSVVLERPDELRKGMIVLAEISEGVYVLHRITDMKADRVKLMGDGNIKGYECCAVTDVKAVATAILRNEKSIDCNGRKHRRLAAIWSCLLPVRRWLLAIYRRIF